MTPSHPNTPAFINNFISRLGLNQTDKDKLSSISEEIYEHLEGLNRAQKDYKEFINNLYNNNENKPFRWNKDNPGKEENFQKDCQQYLELIDHCIYAGDEELLNQWGIQPLRSPHNSLLALNLDVYQDEFEQLLNDPQEELTAKQRNYINSLINALKVIFNSNA